MSAQSIWDILHNKEFIGGISVALTLLGALCYLIGLFRGQAKPHTITWGIWAVIMAIVFLGQLKEGAGPGCWTTGLGVLYTSTTFCVALRRGETSISRFDWTCLFLAILAIVTYCCSAEVIYSMLLATSIDVLGYLPTYKKSLPHPEEEDVAPWVFYSFGSLFTIFAVAEHSLTTLVYPVSINLMNWGLLSILLFGRRKAGRLPQTT